MLKKIISTYIQNIVKDAQASFTDQPVKGRA